MQSSGISSIEARCIGFFRKASGYYSEVRVTRRAFQSFSHANTLATWYGNDSTALAYGAEPKGVKLFLPDTAITTVQKSLIP